jgi:hypothetical protein
MIKKFLKDVGIWIDKVTGNYFFKITMPYITWRFLEANQANKILANVMMYFAVVAFIQWILEKWFDIKTPYFPLGKMFKAYRNSKVLENPDSIKENIEMTYDELVKITNQIKKGRCVMLKKFYEWLLANKVTVSGVLGFVFYVVDTHMDLTAKWGMTEEWYYVLASFIVLVVITAIGGRGFEKATLIGTVKGLYAKAREDAKAARAVAKKLKLKQKNAFLLDALREEMVKPQEHKQDLPEVPNDTERPQVRTFK